MTKLYWISVNKDNGTYDEFEVEADSMGEAENKAFELTGCADIGEIYVEEITE